MIHDYERCEQCMGDLALYGSAYFDTGEGRHIPPSDLLIIRADDESFTESQKRTITARFAPPTPTRS